MKDKNEKWQCIHCGSIQIEAIKKPVREAQDLKRIEKFVCGNCKREIRETIYAASCTKCDELTFILFTTREKFNEFIEDSKNYKCETKCIHCNGNLRSAENIRGMVVRRAESFDYKFLGHRGCIVKSSWY